jgi:2-dehydro-3-deoxyphosphogluconate aldolase/(4S)-4-hydroxy-2-oxoglutarate aldolase
MPTRNQRCTALEECAVIAVVRLDSPDKLQGLVEALGAGGVTAIEFTMTMPGALEALRSLAPAYPDYLFGAGTVLDAEVAQQAVDAGAQFIVSPVIREGLIKIGHENQSPVALGCLTPTELLDAHQAGADFVKLFPASSVGPSYLRALRGPLPQLRIMPTGGVSLENAAAYLQAGAACLGIGGNLVNKTAIREDRFEEITAYAQKLMQAVDSALERD